ncbi:hypothetical protein BDN72DRAFT_900863 [Pluteus cervinus]|uniref:Uncharacterized protein n=1 Tax=Pluteus cervinus TaxID=181527 RepID=A0ACD3AHV3_9AGAR|nr:hypothetical protein BDN72DRAFT_900863 [Pluteus cervinus]
MAKSESAISLPVELERVIFELAAQIDPATVPSLALVSSYVSPWVLPIIYETLIVCLSSDENGPPIPSLERYGKYVRHLLVGHHGSTVAGVTSIFALCPNITHLALWAVLILDGTALEGLKRLPLIRLSIHMESLFDLSQSMIPQAERIFPSFPQLTHLDVANHVPEQLSDCLEYLPRLIYLSLPDDSKNSGLESPEEILDALPNLKFILFLTQDVDDSIKLGNPPNGIKLEELGSKWPELIVTACAPVWKRRSRKTPRQTYPKMVTWKNSSLRLSSTDILRRVSFHHMAKSESAISLPVELERVIFELAAQIDPATVPSLALVSSYVSPWVLPIIYETLIVCLSSDENGPPIPSLERYGKYVRHLLVGHHGSTVAGVTSIFALCPNITHLALWAVLILDGTALEGLKRLPLIRLSIHMESLFDLSQSMIPQAERIFPSFPQLTHLDVANHVPEQLSDCLEYLPRLIYLSLPDDSKNSGLESPEEILDALPNLKVI